MSNPMSDEYIKSLRNNVDVCEQHHILDYDTQDYIGELNGEYCDVCGCELFENKIGEKWCSHANCIIIEEIE